MTYEFFAIGIVKFNLNSFEVYFVDSLTVFDFDFELIFIQIVVYLDSADDFLSLDTLRWRTPLILFALIKLDYFWFKFILAFVDALLCLAFELVDLLLLLSLAGLFHELTAFGCQTLQFSV